MLIDPWNVFTADFGSMPKPGTTLVTLLDLAIYFAFSGKVSMARKKHDVPAPSVNGPDAFLRVLRVQENTVEQLILHLPLLWICALAMDDAFAASLGAVWALGRVLYARGYYQKAKRRAKGYFIGLIVNFILFVAAVVSTVASF